MSRPFTNIFSSHMLFRWGLKIEYVSKRNDKFFFSEIKFFKNLFCKEFFQTFFPKNFFFKKLFIQKKFFFQKNFFFTKQNFFVPKKIFYHPRHPRYPCHPPPQVMRCRWCAAGDAPFLNISHRFLSFLIVSHCFSPYLIIFNCFLLFLIF